MKSSSSQAESETQTGQTDPVVQLLNDVGLAVTLENYVAINFDGFSNYDDLGAEELAQIPDFLKPAKGDT